MKFLPLVVLFALIFSCKKKPIEPLSDIGFPIESVEEIPAPEEGFDEGVDPADNKDENVAIHPDLSQYKSYMIKGGRHNSVSAIKILREEELKFKAIFDHTAIYELPDKNQADINKLFGFSDCGSYHHTNSARFGWRWYKNQVQIFAYCYTNGERISKYLTSVDLGKEYTYSIKIKDNKYHLSVNNSSCVIERGCIGSGTKYYLYPYFGGTLKAPHDIVIRVLEI